MVNMEIQERFVGFLSYKTYCRIVLSDGGKVPLLLVHGGPGSGHDSFELLDDLAYQDERTVIMYDQLGCGRSSDESIPDELLCEKAWTMELENLLKNLGFPEVYLLGHSWGGMLVMSYLIERRPSGIRGAILSSTLPSAKLWEEEAKRLVGYLGEADRKAVKEALELKDFSSLEFENAVAHYSRLFIAPEKGEDLPECLRRQKPKQGRKAYERNWGPCEFVPTGELKAFDYTQRLGEIACPVLVISGTDDESTPLINKTIYDALSCPKSWSLLSGARHMTYFDRKEEYIKAVMEFMKREDDRHGQR